MAHQPWRCTTRGEFPASRRQFLTAVGGAAAAGLAGCSQLTSKEFSAGKVILPQEARDELVLAETLSDSTTTKRTPSAGDVDGEIEATSHTAGYHRGPARQQPTLMEKFIGKVNGRKGAGPASVVTASDVGIDEMTMAFLKEEPTVSGDDIGLIAPAGIRGGDELDWMSTMALVPASAMPGSRWVPGNQWFPGSSWFPGSRWVPGSRWFPGSEWVPENPEDLQVLAVTQGDSFEQVFGASPEGAGGQPLEDGEEIPAENTVFAIPGTDWVPGSDWVPGNEWTSNDPFRTGQPAPLGGATFGTGVVATPTAKMGGKVQNPFAKEDLQTLIQSDRATTMLQQAGLTRAEDAEWLAGPEDVSDTFARATGNNPFIVLGQEAELKSFAGVVSGQDGAWGVGLHIARVVVDGEDDPYAVIGAGGHQTPVYSPDAGYNHLDDRWFTRAAKMTAATLKRLERA